jgi:hypothetical protein
MHQRVCFSHSVRKKETSEKLSKELYFLNSVKETMFKRNFPKNCVQEKNQRTRVRFKKKRAKLIAETKLAANKEIDRAKNEINENEKRHENLSNKNVEITKAKRHENLSNKNVEIMKAKRHENLSNKNVEITNEMQQQDLKAKQHEKLSNKNVEITN